MTFCVLARAQHGVGPGDLCVLARAPEQHGVVASGPCKWRERSSCRLAQLWRFFWTCMQPALTVMFP